MPTLSGLQMKTWTDSLVLKLLSNFCELYFYLNIFKLFPTLFYSTTTLLNEHRYLLYAT